MWILCLERIFQSVPETVVTSVVDGDVKMASIVCIVFNNSMNRAFSETIIPGVKLYSDRLC